MTMDKDTKQKNIEVPENSGAFTVSEFLAWSRIGRTRAYDEIAAGRLKIKKFGRKTLIARSDAQAWLEALPEAA